MKFDQTDAQILLTALTDHDDRYIVCHGEQTIYGTGTAQKVYLRVQEYLQLKPRPRDRKAKDLAGHVDKPHIVKEDYPAISNYWLSVKNQYVANTLPDTTPAPKSRFWGDFDDTYTKGPAHIDPRTLPGVIKGPEIQGPGAGAFVPRDNATLIDDIIVRRSCKFLLYDSIQRKQDIAYVLDDLDLNVVAQRLKVQEATDRLGVGTVEQKVPVCTSELREIFRRWDFFRDNLTFYKEWLVTDPPWFRTGVQHWATYAVHLAGKIVAARPLDAPLGVARGRVVAFNNAGDYLMAILTFHDEMRPSRVLPGAFINQVTAH